MKFRPGIGFRNRSVEEPCDVHEIYHEHRKIALHEHVAHRRWIKNVGVEKRRVSYSWLALAHILFLRLGCKLVEHGFPVSASTEAL